MISKMLIAVDQTEASQQALIQASMLARSEKSQVVLQSVIPSYDGDLRMMGKTEALAQMRAPYQEALNKAVETIKHMNLSPKSVLDEGKPFSKILTLADQEQVDLIVVNRNSRFPVDRIPIGETISKVVNQSERDILVIPAGSTLSFDRILVAVDQSSYSDIALSRAIEICATYGAELNVVTAYEVPLEGFSYSPKMWETETRSAKKVLQAAVDKANMVDLRKVESFLKHGKPAEEIMGLAVRNGAGLIVLGYRSIHSMRKALLNNVVEKVIRHGKTPIWIAKNVSN